MCFSDVVFNVPVQVQVFKYLMVFGISQTSRVCETLGFLLEFSYTWEEAVWGLELKTVW